MPNFHMNVSFKNLHVNQISFSYEVMSTETRFEKEAKGIFDLQLNGSHHQKLDKNVKKSSYGDLYCSV